MNSGCGLTQVKRLCLSWLALSFTLAIFTVPRHAMGQAGLREALERLDRDGDGEVEPEEITPQARPYLERIAQGKRLSLDRDNDIEDLQESARIYHATQSGVAGREIQPERKGTIHSFGIDDDQFLVPDFGLAEIKYRYTNSDLEDADRSLRRNDQNEDGFIDRREALDGHWTHGDPFDVDFDKDDRLSRMELAQRYARRRLMSDDSQELIQRARRVGIGIRPTPSPKRDSDDSQWWRQGGSSHWLTASMMSRFDTNRNGRLENSEYQDLGFPASRVDIDRDGELSREELHNYLSQVQAEAGDESEGVPGWFYELDVDRDGQVAMAEFSEEWTEPKSREFAMLDLNSDGLLTASEVARSKAMVGGSYNNQSAEPIPPHKTIISEIEINDDVLIGDLNVQLSITHSNTSFLDGYLTSPSGERVELFSEVGGSGDHFEHTIFDDQAQTPINKAQPPFHGSYLTTASVKRQPSLGQFSGQNARGIWQLVVRGTRSDRFGMLHDWSLIIQPKDAMLDAASVQEVDVHEKLPDANVNRNTEPSLPNALSGIDSPRNSERERSRTEFHEQLKQKKLSEEETAKYLEWFDAKRSGTPKENPKGLNKDEKRERKLMEKDYVSE